MGDPMDLGGFMQNFVLKNPFQDMVLAGGTKDEKPSTPPTKSPPSSTSSSPISIAPKPAAPVVPTVVPVVTPAQAPVPSCSSRSPPEQPAPAAAAAALPKAHVGSNQAFAMNLKQNKVSESHSKLQLWLWRHYKQVLGYNRLYSSKELLRHVNRAFPSVSSIVLSRVMKFSFPHVSKVINKSGYYYEGLVPRPTRAQASDKKLRKFAAQCLKDNLLLSYSARKSVMNYNIDVVAGVMYWIVDKYGCYDVEDDNDADADDDDDEKPMDARVIGDDIYKKMIARHWLDVHTDTGVDLQGDVSEEEEGEWAAEEELEEEEEGEEEGETKARNKRKRKPGRSRSAKKKRTESSDEWSPSRDGTDKAWKPPCINNTTTRPARPPRKCSPTKSFSRNNSIDTRGSFEATSLDTHLHPSVNSVVKQEAVEAGEMENYDEDYKAVREQLCQDSNQFQPVEVKPEPVDAGFNEPAGTSNNDSQNRTSEKDPKQSCSSYSYLDPLQCKAKDNLIGTLRNVVVQRHLSSKTDLLERELEESRHQNGILLRNFRESQKNVHSLQGQLAERDITLSQLAEDFFDLQRRFERLSGQFKQALCGMVQSNLNNNEKV